MSFADLYQPIRDCGRCLWVALRRQINYIKDLDGSWNELKEGAQYLKNKKENIIQETNRDNVSASKECEEWLNKVGRIETEVNTIEAELGKDKRCLNGLCPFRDIWWRKKLGERIDKGIKQVKKLREESKFEGVEMVVVDYAKNIYRNLEKLRKKLGDLRARRTDIEREMEGKVNTRLTNECQGWLGKVEEVENEFNRIEAKFQSRGPSRKLGERIMNLTDEVLEINKASKFKGGVVIHDYVMNIIGNHLKLKEAFRDLESRTADVERMIKGDALSKVPSSECQDWLRKVDEVKNKVESVKKLDLTTTVPSSASGQKIGRDIVSLRNEIVELYKASKFMGEVVMDAPIKTVERLDSSKIQKNTSINRTLENILRCIKDEKIQKIGIWGMGGVGKTTIMKLLNNQPEISQMFQIVIWVTVSKNWNRRKVQDEIWQRLSRYRLDINTSDDRVQRNLSDLLSNKRYLLLLDDLWEEVDLTEVGVPTPSTGNGCKIVLTTRSLNVCNKMEIDRAIKIETLSEEEAWDLFRMKVGDIITSPIIEETDRDIIRECGGLPLAVLVIGGSLRNEKDHHVWKQALEELRFAEAEYEIIEDMEELVFKKLKFSYDRLKSENIKNCFLYVALFREDYWIPDTELIKYWLGEGFITNDDNGYAIANRLINASLFERNFMRTSRGKITSCVKMHDVIRDLALRIISPLSFLHDKGEGRRFLVRERMRLQEPLDYREWIQVHRVSLIGNSIQRFPRMPDCPSLLTLFLQWGQNDLYKMPLPQEFFRLMPNLRVLHLSLTDFVGLPLSISLLPCLQYLNLSSSQLYELPPFISNLTSLRILKLSDNKIRELPSSFSELENLEDLNLSETMFAEFPSALLNLKSIRSLDLCPIDRMDTLPNGIGALKTLEVLHLGRRITYLPDGVCQLTRLKALHLQLITARLNQDALLGARRMIPHGMLSSLLLLEDLALPLNPVPWMADKHWFDVAEDMAKELVNLKRLTRLHFCFVRLESFGHFVQESSAWKNKQLKSFNLLLCINPLILRHSDPQHEHRHEGIRYLKWSMGEVNLISDEITEELPRLGFTVENIETFCDHCQVMKTLVTYDGFLSRKYEFCIVE